MCRASDQHELSRDNARSGYTIRWIAACRENPGTREFVAERQEGNKATRSLKVGEVLISS